MTSSLFLSVENYDSYNLLQAPRSPLQRRGSFNDLQKSGMTLSPCCDHLPEKKWKSSEIIKAADSDALIQIPEIHENKVQGDHDNGNYNDEKEELKEIQKNEENNDTIDEDTITQDEDERMFLEYQRCAMATRRRRSFNDRKGSEGGDSYNGYDSCRSSLLSTSETPTESLSGQSSRRGSIYLMLPDSPMQSLSTPSSPKSSPRSSIYVVSGEEGRLTLAPNSGWNRLKRMFKENKLKESGNDHNNNNNNSNSNNQTNGNTINSFLNKPVPYNLFRRGSCDSQLQTARLNKHFLHERTSIPDSLSFDEYDFDSKDIQGGKSDGWARLKKKFKEGKLKPMMEEISANLVKMDSISNSNNNSGSSSPITTSHKTSSNGNKKMKKGEKNYTGKNALHNAVIESDLNAVKRIIDSGKYDINFLKPPGLTALHVACAFGNIKIIEHLISNGADIHVKTWSRISPLQISTLFGHFEVCQYLISHGASSIDVQDGFVHDLKLMSSVLVK